MPVPKTVEILIASYNVDDIVEWSTPISVYPGLIVALRTGNPLFGLGAVAITIGALFLFGEICQCFLRWRLEKARRRETMS